MASTLIADVCKIEEIEPHPDADRLELVRIKNWWCVVQRNMFLIGDKVVYIPPGTVVPTSVADKWGVTKYCSTLPKLGDGTRPDGVRVRTSKLRGVASQGLIIPLENKDWEIGHSVIEHYGLSKYEPPEPVNAGEAIPAPETFHRFTDIENIGNYTDVFIDGEEVVVDEKIHGTNGRTGIIQIDGEMQLFCGGHNQCLKEISDSGKRCSYWTAMDEKMKNLLYKFSNNHQNVIVFVEIYGRKIQDMEYGMNQIGYRAYDISVNARYLDYDEKMRAFNEFEIEVAPLLYRGPFSMRKMQELVDGPTKMCDPTNAGIFQGREGIVIRPVKETYNLKIGRKILKMISVDYDERKGKKTEFH
jgi:RNA ligase (TIGR02306 family)